MSTSKQAVGEPPAGDSGWEGFLQQARPLLKLAAAPQKEKSEQIISTNSFLTATVWLTSPKWLAGSLGRLARLAWTGLAG